MFGERNGEWQADIAQADDGDPRCAQLLLSETAPGARRQRRVAIEGCPAGRRRAAASSISWRVQFECTLSTSLPHPSVEVVIPILTPMLPDS
jgi:hypothetical protein